MTFPVICDAIRLRHVVRFQYRGGVREVEPYVYGRDASGNELLRGFQLRGASRTGEAVGWKVFHVEDMINVAVTFEAFSARDAYEPGDKVIVFVNARVEPS
jgi:hypothetical protein